MEHLKSGSASPRTTAGQEVQIYSYFGALTLLIYLATPSGYLVDIATSFMLKNQLKVNAEDISRFRLLTAVPAFFAFFFGVVRDQWSPFGLRDRGYFLVFAPMTGAVFVWMAFSKLELSTLTIGVFVAMATFRLAISAYQGLVSLVGQERMISGRISTLWNIGLTVSVLLGAWSSGWVTEHLSPRSILLIIAVICFAIGLFGVWKLRAVFFGIYDQPRAKRSNVWHDVKRLVKHRAIYGAILINFFWSFSPGANTPLQFYLTDRLHLPDSAYANYNAIFAASFIPTFLLYGFLCKRVPQSKLLLWGTVVGVPQMVPLLFVHSALAAQLMAVPIGLMGGVATAAYLDLAIRSCPPGLQGTLMMLIDGLFVLAARGGDRFGTWIYELNKKDGFLYCAIATSIVYALILPLLLLVPKNLIATRDGETSVELETELLNEIAATT